MSEISNQDICFELGKIVGKLRESRHTDFSSKEIDAIEYAAQRLDSTDMAKKMGPINNGTAAEKCPYEGPNGRN